MNLAARHRPTVFRDVVGQDAAVEFLRRLTAGGRGNVLLVGPTGCGKSTLGELYAASLLCPAFDGLERCGACPDCRLYDDGRHPNLRSLEFGSEQDDVIVHEIVKDVASETLSRGWQVFILDHVDHSSSRTLDVLRDRLERTPQRVVFIGCAEKQSAVPEWLRTSLFELQINFVDTAACLKALDRIAAAEAFQVHEDALLMVADRSGGSMRAAVRDLEALCVGQRITTEGASAYYRVPLAEAICSYLDALLVGDLKQQCRAFEEWPGSPRSKATVLDDLFSAMYIETQRLPYVLTHRLLSAEKLFDYAVRLTARAQVLDIGEHAFWHQILSHWRPETVSTNRSFLRRVFLLHEILDEASQGVETLIDNASANNAASKVKQPRTPDPTDDDRVVHLTEAQARKLWAAASFMGQKHGVLFNTRITVRYDALGIIAVEEAIEFLGALTHELGQIVANRSVKSLHWAYVHERDTQGLRTNIAAFIPIPFVDIESWLKDFSERRAAPSNSTALVCRMLGSGGRDSIRRHRFLMQLLCRSLDPACDALGQMGERVILLDGLGIYPCLRSASRHIGLRQRCRVSKGIGREAQRRSIDDGFPLFSPIQRQAWGWLYSGWELEEHASRQVFDMERKDRLRDLENRFPPAGGKAVEARRLKKFDDLREDWLRQGKARASMWFKRWKNPPNSK